VSQPDSVRTAHARLAALRRWRPTDAAALAAARRDLQVAHATKLTASAVAVLRGDR
jgi:hypothetical protein